MIRVFLDANVLFSATLGGPAFELLWALSHEGKVRLLTSRYCLLEAETNLRRKRPEDLARLESRCRDVEMVAESNEIARWNALELPPKDVPVFAAAVAGQADVLITGDLKDFGALMKRTDLPLRVRTVRDFLLEGQPKP